MSKKENARTDAAAPTRANEQAAEHCADYSSTVFSTSTHDLQHSIYNYLKCGKENAVSTKDLVALLNLENSRVLRQIVERERLNGSLILSTCHGHGGYFLPSNDPETARQEILEFTHTVNNRAISSLRMLQTAHRALRVLPGQTEIEGAAE